MRLATLDIAKQAKEIGFNATCTHWFFIEENGNVSEHCGLQSNTEPTDSLTNVTADEYLYLATEEIITRPYLDAIADFLRRYKEVHIEILYDYEYDDTPYHYNIRRIGKSQGRNWGKDFSTYDDALEAALLEALTFHVRRHIKVVEK